MCGEQYPSAPWPTWGIGSPPRVRGTALLYDPADAPARITPACAGNRSILWRARKAIKDHPRVCGEQVSIFPFPVACIGSPPRVRGTVGDVDDVDGGVGITPACAGNSKEENI